MVMNGVLMVGFQSALGRQADMQDAAHARRRSAYHASTSGGYHLLMRCDTDVLEATGYELFINYELTHSRLSLA